MKKSNLLFLFLLVTNTVLAQLNNPPALNAITIQDLKKDLYAFADAHFNGRSAGTLDELKASMWLADQYRAIGLKPAGDDGTYFQYFTLWRNHIADNASVVINNTTFSLWKDVAVAQMANISLNAPIVYLGNALDIDTSKIDVKGKVIAIEANAKGINLNVSLPTWRYNRYVFTKYGLPLIKKGAIAIIFIADDVAENAWEDAAENFKRGTYDIDGGVNENVTTTVPVLWFHASAKALLQQNTATIKANLIVAKYPYPSVNVVGKIDGTDAKLKAEYLLYSGHTDAHGIRNEIKNDSIYYGADDNGSVDVAMLANARAFIKKPAKRSVIFVIHGAEERGLLGSRYFSSHPTVPIKNIVAVLNGDMIGRNTTDSAAILGMKPPHRNSLDLVTMALDANNEGPKFKLDDTWDDVSHIEGWYFRSDHLPYARLGIPAIMYTSLLHPDYHTPQDNAESINYPKLKKMADWMYRTGWKVANATNRPATDKGFKLER
ncbi:M28 family peptidase [Arcicella aquatica]|uniref:M28 family peptidase n=1 Tax=Arcicella aquatica TaxID=217141 RepID=A0ABU5QT02_9BACT|nr:M28 family peptidase [Arcicella aquatica]MEA5260236.1 M28 family peptidase [Arcicella aquatica]